MLRWMWMLSLVACAPDLASPPADVAEQLPGEALAVPSGRHLTLGASQLVSGDVLTLKAEGALPGERVTFLRGTGYAAGTTCPPLLGGLCLNLAGAGRIDTATADRSGIATVDVFLPAGVPNAGAQIAFAAAVTSPDQTISQVEPRVASAAPGTYAVGARGPYEGYSSHSPDYILGTPILVVDGGVLESFGIFSDGGGDGRLSLWTDAGGAPDQLVEESQAFASPAGSLTVRPANGGVRVGPGKYWLMGHYRSGAAPGMGTADSYMPVAYRSQSFAAGSPATFGPATFYTGQSFNYWINLR